MNRLGRVINPDGIWRPEQWPETGHGFLVVRRTRTRSLLDEPTVTQEVDQSFRFGKKWPRRFNTEEEAQLRCDVLNGARA